MLAVYKPLPEANPQLDNVRQEDYHGHRLLAHNLRGRGNSYYLHVVGFDGTAQINSEAVEKMAAGAEAGHMLFICVTFDNRNLWANPSDILELEERKADGKITVEESDWEVLDPWDEDAVLQELKGTTPKVATGRNSNLQEEILKAVADSPDGLTLNEIAEATDRQPSSISSLLNRMFQEGQLGRFRETEQDKHGSRAMFRYTMPR